MSDEGERRFGDALSELEDIVQRIETDNVDLDDLAGYVDRAAELVTFCRERIDATEHRVRSIIDGLQPESEGTT